MPSSHSRQIPLAYSLLSAGPAVEVCDEGYALLDVNALICGGRDGFLAFVVTGDSMAEDIRPGYIVFIDTCCVPRNGDIVAVNVNGQNCIKIFEQRPNRLYLVPRNAEYPTTEIQPSDSLHILGVVRAHLAVHV